MRRFLLYDDKCERCGNIARTVERNGNGWLMIRGLSDPDVRKMLDSAKPGWKWQPMLVVLKGNRIRLYSGAMMILASDWGPYVRFVYLQAVPRFRVVNSFYLAILTKISKHRYRIP